MEEKRSEEEGMRLDYGGPRSLPPDLDVTPTSQSVDSNVRTLRPLRFKDLGMRFRDDMTQEEAYSVELVPLAHGLQEESCEMSDPVVKP
jgi:hypothetical protein